MAWLPLTAGPVMWLTTLCHTDVTHCFRMVQFHKKEKRVTMGEGRLCSDLGLLEWPVDWGKKYTFGWLGWCGWKRLSSLVKIPASGPVALALLGIFLEIQKHGPHPRRYIGICVLTPPPHGPRSSSEPRLQVGTPAKLFKNRCLVSTQNKGIRPQGRGWILVFPHSCSVVSRAARGEDCWSRTSLGRRFQVKGYV